ncbi:MAG: hypothetical protein JHD02_00665 [Thermoleophilaceae bacterium]|nr:hypothetical protein [Thermoleophilaceae bacterium]
MGTSRDLYKESEQIAEALVQLGEPDAAARIRDVIAGGSTSSEILFGLRSEFDRLLKSEDLGDQHLRSLVKDVRSEVSRALR